MYTNKTESNKTKTCLGILMPPGQETYQAYSQLLGLDQRDNHSCTAVSRSQSVKLQKHNATVQVQQLTHNGMVVLCKLPHMQ